MLFISGRIKHNNNDAVNKNTKAHTLKYTYIEVTAEKLRNKLILKPVSHKNTKRLILDELESFLAPHQSYNLTKGFYQ